jgi:hypothetical protein
VLRDESQCVQLRSIAQAQRERSAPTATLASVQAVTV